MTSSYSILQQGDARLEQQAQAVSLSQQRSGASPHSPKGSAPSPRSRDSELQQLIEDLIALTLDRNGVGIAAPQVGIPQRLIIVASRPNGRYPNAPLMEPTAMINPRLLDCSDQKVGGWEGCLSVPGQRGWIQRPQQIQVEYWDRWGDRQTALFQDFIARIFQHELDHLNGILFPERLAPGEPLVSEVEFLQRLSRQH